MAGIDVIFPVNRSLQLVLLTIWMEIKTINL